MVALAERSIRDEKSGKYFAFCDAYVPDPGNYRIDLWGPAGFPNGPASWEDLRVGGAKIRATAGNPVGIGLSQELDSNMALRALLWSFGGAEQDETGRVVLNSRETVEALKFARALYRETMTPEVFTWDPASNNRMMLAGRGSFVQNAISVTRTAEKDNPELARKIGLLPALAGPVRRIAAEHLINCYVIWKFAENIEGAKAVPRGSRGQLPVRLPRERVLQHAGLPGDRAGSVRAAREGSEERSARQVPGPGRRARLVDQRGLPGAGHGGDRRGLQHLRHPDALREGGARRRGARGCRGAGRREVRRIFERWGRRDSRARVPDRGLRRPLLGRLARLRALSPRLSREPLRVAGVARPVDARSLGLRHRERSGGGGPRRALRPGHRDRRERGAALERRAAPARRVPRRPRRRLGASFRLVRSRHRRAGRSTGSTARVSGRRLAAFSFPAASSPSGATT